MSGTSSGRTQMLHSNYVALKRDLAVKFRDDRERYTDNKAPLIEQMLVQARTWRGACSMLNLP